MPYYTILYRMYNDKTVYKRVHIMVQACSSCSIAHGRASCARALQAPALEFSTKMVAS